VQVCAFTVAHIDPKELARSYSLFIRFASSLATAQIRKEHPLNPSTGLHASCRIGT
jgi:hypothetical protein